MPHEWTKDQLDAIQTRNSSLLVSAAAGSGKTATLTQRIISSLIDGKSDLSHILVVTFTRAAAADMRRKIAKTLDEAILNNPTNENLAHQLLLLDSAKICTIDSFCFDVVKSNFNKLSISKNIRLADEAEIALLYADEMEESIRTFYKEDPSFPYLIECFSDIRKTDKAAQTFINIYKTLLSSPKGIQALGDMEEDLRAIGKKDFLETNLGAFYHSMTVDAVRHAKDFFAHSIHVLESYTDDAPRIKYLPSFAYDLDYSNKVLDALKNHSYAAVRDLLFEYSPLSLQAIRGADKQLVRLKDARDDVKGIFKKLKIDFYQSSPEDLIAQATTTADICHGLYDLFSVFEKKIQDEKSRRNICAFSDLRRMALSLMVDSQGQPTPLALSYRDKFTEIYIDEYQDVDQVQDMIFSAIARPGSRFMVGDIKQSIYRFRGADCSVFSEYRAAFPPLAAYPGGEGATIFMSENFRCDRNIIDFSNLISRYMFMHCGSALAYKDQDDLKYHKIQPSTHISPRVQVAVIDGKANEETKQYDCEAMYIAEEITRLMKQNILTDDVKPLCYSDIAVLLRSNVEIPQVRKTLSALHIPSVSTEEPNFFENPDVLLLLSLLATLDNPRQDISLSGVLRSPIYGFSMTELIQIRNASDNTLSLYDALVAYAQKGNPLGKKCEEFSLDLSHYRRLAQSLSVSKLMKLLFREKGILAMAEDSTDHLLRFYEYARVFESGGYRGLYHFIRYIEKIIEKQTTLKKTDSGPEQNAVKIITIHYSKGLEFPVCFLYGIEKKFNREFTKESFQLNPHLGFGIKIKDKTGFGCFETNIFKSVEESEKKAQTLEEMRVLYVAMTRAQNYLYLVAKSTGWESKVKSVMKKIVIDSDYAAQNASGFLDWIIPALEGAQDTSSFEIKQYTPQEIVQDFVPPPALPDIIATPPEDENPDTQKDTLSDILTERFSYNYPYRHLSELPAKLSVSHLFPTVLDEGVQLDTEVREEDFILPDSLEDAATVTSSEKGTATHTFLQFCDFALVEKQGIREELNRLTIRKFMDERMTRLVNIRQLSLFFESHFYKELKTASEIHREQRFNIFLPAAEFTEDPEKKKLLSQEEIAVQGVIDIFFTDKDGKLVLADYKTDYLTSEEMQDSTLAAAKLTSRHRRQLCYYAQALKEMCGRFPDKILIYSLPLGKAVEVIPS